MIPDREPTREDPIIHPYRDGEQSAVNNFAIARWLRWRLRDNALPANLRDIMTVEMQEAEDLGRLLEAVDEAEGKDMDEKMSDPRQRELLKALSLRWMRSQRRLLDVAVEHTSIHAQGNGN